jgi:hypothetical protein
VALFLPGFLKWSQNAIYSVGVDTISRGTGKRDRRIGNPGLNRACLGYGRQESPDLGRIRDHAITLKKSTKNPGPKMPRITPFSPPNKSVSQKTKSVSGFAMPKTAGFTPVKRSGPAKRI